MCVGLFQPQGLLCVTNFVPSLLLPSHTARTAGTRKKRKKEKRKKRERESPIHWLLPSRTWNRMCVTTDRLRPRSTIRLSRTIRSVATENQWSGPIKLRILSEFLPSRRTESDGGSGPLQVDAKVSFQSDAVVDGGTVSVPSALAIHARIYSTRRDVYSTVGLPTAWLRYWVLLPMECGIIIIIIIITIIIIYL